ncbi:DUF3592 domain-containing protein [Yoonia sp. 2307UL14-13]|uniref:DUF3592 domain-containing protein n=1 Tax=Yoonia sp. 2307UL14-13 TaxID=3126506 RepID=UPI0030B5F44F
MIRLRVTLVILASVLVTALGIWLAITATQQLNQAAALQLDSQQAVATVSQKWIVAGESRDNSHRIRYSFLLDGKELVFERAVPVALHRVVHSGSPFQVTFSPSDPDLHEIFPGQIAGTARSKLTSGLMICGIGLLIFVVGGGGRIFRRRTENV